MSPIDWEHGTVMAGGKPYTFDEVLELYNAGQGELLRGTWIDPEKLTRFWRLSVLARDLKANGGMIGVIQVQSDPAKKKPIAAVRMAVQDCAMFWEEDCFDFAEMVRLADQLTLVPTPEALWITFEIIEFFADGF